MPLLDFTGLWKTDKDHFVIIVEFFNITKLWFGLKINNDGKCMGGINYDINGNTISEENKNWGNLLEKYRGPDHKGFPIVYDLPVSPVG